MGTSTIGQAETSAEDMPMASAGMRRVARPLLGLVSVLLLFQFGLVIRSALADEWGGPASLSITPDVESDRVSATAGEFRVDESGAATYAVPLYVVPGTAGVAPQLSLSYSSQGGYGPLGMGWSIGGLSSITRCRATREHGDFIVSGVPTDGTPEPVNFTATDRYCLDGQRLIPAQATGTAACPAVSGMTAVNLRTEIESFQRVCAYTPMGGTTGPAFFTVDRKDGSRSWYGDRAADTTDMVDGYFNATTPGKEGFALAWAQTRFQDSTGNYIDYLYSEKPAGGTAGEQVISEVRYTGKKVLSGQSGGASAPYAKVVFHYSARPTTQWEYRYASGGQYVSSRRLDGITVCATIACATGDQARYYALTYGTSVSYSGRDTLTSLKECRDSTQAVCMAPTTFEWSTGKHEFATQETLPGLGVNNSQFKGFKLGDINGDGLTDFIYLRSGVCGGEGIVTALASLNSAGQPVFTNSGTLCLPTAISSRGEGAWHLFDYTGDGRDDLFVSAITNAGWRLYPSVGNGFNAAQNLLATLPIPSLSNVNDQAQLADVNGDGLVDVLYPAGGTLKARVMTRQTGGGFAWGPERSVAVDESTYPMGPDCNGGPGNMNECNVSFGGLPSPKTGFVQMTDFNGDGASDVLLHVNETHRIWTGNCQIPVQPQQLPRSGGERTVAVWAYRSSGAATPAASLGSGSCYDIVTNNLLYAFTVQEITPGGPLTLAAHASLGTVPQTVALADVNGDGLTDVLTRFSSTAAWVCKRNTGTTMIGSCGDNPTITDDRDQARFVDVNGDGRADALRLRSLGGNRVYEVQYAQPSGGFGPVTSLPGGNARFCSGSCDVNQYVPVFMDVDGDGNLDFLSLRLDSPSLYVSRPSLRHQPRDTLTAIVNGFGARTELAYAPLTNNAIYRRDTGSRDGTNWGRGAPVQDLLAPMYVVASASSSAPQDGNPLAMASLYYRYAGAKVQAGGRGYLGFREIVTFDPNQTGGYVATATTYRQDFPFTGMPARTIKHAFSGQTYTPSACLTGTVTSTCYSTPGAAFPGLGGSWFADSKQFWEADTDNTTGEAAFAAGVQAPLH
ncbi:MAG: toxin TcdB middle/N-terminal domain-containing protein, partial [Thermomonas sp.]|uniref:toxin TcdB middle/N-terminal domain-containing protein n=1 Tax=Thermomonas sp. TaxID=1971895 RepID=UPI0039E6EF39